jgi:DNA-directed RNA polymerase alpha subunit
MLGLPIDELVGISTRTRNCLRRLDVRTAGDVLDLDEQEVLSTLNAGRTTLVEVMALAERIRTMMGPRPQPSPAEEVMGMPLKAFGLISTRASKCLARRNVRVARDLLLLKEEEIMATRGTGRTTLAEIQDLAGRIRNMMGAPPGAEPGNDTRPGPPKRPRMILSDASRENLSRLLVPLRALPFRARVRHFIEKKHLLVVGDLIQLQEEEFLGERHIGRGSLSHVQDQLRRLGLEMSTEIIGWNGKDVRRLSKLYADDIDNEINRIALSQEAGNLEDELYELTQMADSVRNRMIVTACFGWDGLGPRTLEDVGSEHDLTRERVRQIAQRVENHLAGLGLNPPTLMRVLDEMRPPLACAAREAERRIQKLGLTRGCFRSEGVLIAGRILGLNDLPELTRVGRHRFLVRPGEMGIFRLIQCVARRQVRKWGIGGVEEIIATVRRGSENDITVEAVLEILGACPGFQWLSADHQWFWFSQDFKGKTQVARNPMVRQIQKTLSVARSLHLSELRSSVSRHYRMKGFAPPRRVLLEVCRNLPWTVVDGETISVTADVSWEEVLAGTAESTLVSVLKEFGPVMSRDELEKRCLERGIGSSTFNVQLSNSPALDRVAAGLYRLRGSYVSPEEIESHRMRQKKDKVLQDYGWVEDGRVWIALSISATLLRTGVVGVPSSLSPFIDGRFHLLDARRRRVGDVGARDGRCRGISPFLRRRGAEVGDWMVLIFDGASHKVEALVGDADIVDELGLRPGTSPR